jgi:hypothetical protein
LNALEHVKHRLSIAVTNWQQPMPFSRKLWLLARNISIKAIKRQGCCGHDGEPGC